MAQRGSINTLAVTPQPNPPQQLLARPLVSVTATGAVYDHCSEPESSSCSDSGSEAKTNSKAVAERRREHRHKHRRGAMPAQLSMSSIPEVLRPPYYYPYMTANAESVDWKEYGLSEDDPKVEGLKKDFRAIADYYNYECQADKDIMEMEHYAGKDASEESEDIGPAPDTSCTVQNSIDVDNLPPIAVGSEFRTLKEAWCAVAIHCHRTGVHLGVRRTRSQTNAAMAYKRDKRIRGLPVKVWYQCKEKTCPGGLIMEYNLKRGVYVLTKMTKHVKCNYQRVGDDHCCNYPAHTIKAVEAIIWNTVMKDSATTLGALSDVLRTYGVDVNIETICTARANVIDEHPLRGSKWRSFMEDFVDVVNGRGGYAVADFSDTGNGNTATTTTTTITSSNSANSNSNNSSNSNSSGSSSDGGDGGGGGGIFKKAFAMSKLCINAFCRMFPVLEVSVSCLRTFCGQMLFNSAMRHPCGRTLPVAQAVVVGAVDAGVWGWFLGCIKTAVESRHPGFDWSRLTVLASEGVWGIGEAVAAVFPTANYGINILQVMRKIGKRRDKRSDYVEVWRAATSDSEAGFLAHMKRVTLPLLADDVAEYDSKLWASHASKNPRFGIVSTSVIERYNRHFSSCKVFNPFGVLFVIFNYTTQRFHAIRDDVYKDCEKLRNPTSSVSTVSDSIAITKELAPLPRRALNALVSESLQWCVVIASNAGECIYGTVRNEGLEENVVVGPSTSSCVCGNPSHCKCYKGCKCTCGYTWSTHIPCAHVISLLRVYAIHNKLENIDLTERLDPIYLMDNFVDTFDVSDVDVADCTITVPELIDIHTAKDANAEESDTNELEKAKKKNSQQYITAANKLADTMRLAHITAFDVVPGGIAKEDLMDNETYDLIYEIVCLYKKVYDILVVHNYTKYDEVRLLVLNVIEKSHAVLKRRELRPKSAPNEHEAAFYKKYFSRRCFACRQKTFLETCLPFSKEFDDFIRELNVASKAVREDEICKKAKRPKRPASATHIPNAVSLDQLQGTAPRISNGRSVLNPMILPPMHWSIGVSELISKQSKRSSTRKSDSNDDDNNSESPVPCKVSKV